MKILVIGSGCPKCESLFKQVKKLKQEGKISGEIEYKKGVQELVSRGIMGSPAVLVDGKVVLVGMPKDERALLEAIRKGSR